MERLRFLAGLAGVSGGGGKGFWRRWRGGEEGAGTNGEGTTHGGVPMGGECIKWGYPWGCEGTDSVLIDDLDGFV